MLFSASFCHWCGALLCIFLCSYQFEIGNEPAVLYFIFSTSIFYNSIIQNCFFCNSTVLLVVPSRVIPERITQNSGDSRVSPVRETPQPLWAIRSSTESPQSKEILPRSQVELPMYQFVSSASHPSGLHHQAEPASILLAPPFRNLYTLMISPPSHLFPRLNRPSPLSLS